MQRLLEEGTGNLESIANKAHTIAFFLYAHDNAVRDSETAAQLRILDLELNKAKENSINRIHVITADY